jgi:hypothetical protein
VILVQVRCKVRGCGHLLDVVTDAPAREEDWQCWVHLHICQRHGGGHGSVAKWAAAQQRLGRPYDQVRLMRWVQWSDLRPAVERARRLGRIQQYTI